MGFALVQNKPAGATSTNPTITLTSGPTAGNLIVAVLGTASAAAPTDPAGYTQRMALSGTGGVLRIVSKIAGASESATITWTDGTSRVWEIEAYEFSGNGASGSEFDAADAGLASSTNSGQPGSITPAVASELYIAAMHSVNATGGAEAIDSGFTAVDQASFTRSIHGYKIKTDAAAENPTLSWTTSVVQVMAMVAFKPSTVRARPPRLGLPAAVQRASFR